MRCNIQKVRAFYQIEMIDGKGDFTATLAFDRL
jgi:hypothetical protein